VVRRWLDEEVEELPVITQPAAMFADLVANAEVKAQTKGGALEGASLKGAPPPPVARSSARRWPLLLAHVPQAALSRP
jgi:hypothetical protein